MVKIVNNRNLYWAATVSSSEVFSRPPKIMAKSVDWKKILNFIIELLKLILAVFGGVELASIL